MKLTKKLLSATILVLLFAPAVVKENKRTFSEVKVVADGSLAPVDYDDNNGKKTNPKSIHIITAI